MMAFLTVSMGYGTTALLQYLEMVVCRSCLCSALKTRLSVLTGRMLLLLISPFPSNSTETDVWRKSDLVLAFLFDGSLPTFTDLDLSF